MAEDNRLPRFAILIDADNTSPAHRGGPIRGSRQVRGGERPAHLRRFFEPALEVVGRNPSQIRNRPYQQFAYTTGKNASDIGLVIDAMDLLHGGRLDGFCLVSSDSDFTRLASRLREQGADVYGFGEQKRPKAFGRRAGGSFTQKTCCPRFMPPRLKKGHR